MAQKKKGSRPSGPRGSALWRGSRQGMPPTLIALIILIGVVAAVGGYLLERSPLLEGGSLSRADEAAVAAGLQLNELMSDNATALITEKGDAPDWIEVRNAGSEPVALGGYSLLLGSEFNKIFSFPKETLEPGACALIYAEGMRAGAEHGDWSAPFRLPASGGVTLTLLSPQDQAIDFVELPELGTDEAYARDADGEWQVVKSATPGAANDAASTGGKTGLEIVPDVVELTEVATDNTLYFADENGERHDYVELHNISGADVALEGWYLSDTSSDLKRWSFPAVTLPADGYLAVHCSGLNRRTDAQHLHTDFRLSSGESVYLSRPDGQTVAAVTPPLLAADQAWSLCDGEWSAALAPTPGMENTSEAAARMNAQLFGASGIRLNEIMASAESEPCDWIEIYNASGQAVNLSGYGLSDRSNKPRKWQFPEGTTIQPGEYLSVLLSGKDGVSSGGYLNVNFALASEGGYTVTLSDPSGSVLDAAYLGQQYGGKSYGRADGEDGFFYFDAGTPMAANTGAHYRERAAEAKCSEQGGLFSAGQSFQVTLEAPAGSRVYYTLDSSDPTESSNLYSGPIQISGTTILRTRVYRDGYMPSLIDTQSYLYDVRNESNVYVVSLVSDWDNLTGEANGLASPANLTKDLEREAHVELFLPSGERVVSQGCGISLHGADSRKQPIKSFNVIARSLYGKNRIEYPIFSQRDYQAYQSILLRPSGEDQDMSFMRDSVLTSLMRGSSLMFQEHEICVVYLDGEYYTLCYIRERINKHSICQFEGWEGMEDEIDIVRGNASVTQGSNKTFEELLRWVKSNDTSTDEGYAYLDSHIDIQNFIEYMSIEIFTGNTDLLNVRRYRNPKTDGKWRWALFDLDWAFYNDTDSIGKWLTPGGVGVRNATDNTLFIGCMKNPTFRDQFLTYMGEKLATTFSTENVLAKFTERYDRIEPMLAQYQEKWGYKLSGINRVVSYAKTRPAKLIQYFQNVFKFSDADLEKYFGAAIQKIRESGEEDS